MQTIAPLAFPPKAWCMFLREGATSTSGYLIRMEPHCLISHLFPAAFLGIPLTSFANGVTPHLFSEDSISV